MPFKKGQSGNLYGRPQGSKNSRTLELHSVIISILEKSFRKVRIEKDIMELTPKQRLDFILKLVEFIVPKPKAEELSVHKQETFKDIYERSIPFLQRSSIDIEYLKKEEILCK